jgi:hypothetical protein
LDGLDRIGTGGEFHGHTPEGGSVVTEAPTERSAYLRIPDTTILILMDSGSHSGHHHSEVGPGNEKNYKDEFPPPAVTADGLLYYRKRDGGLGYPKLEAITTGASLNLRNIFLGDTDPVMRAVSQESHLECKLQGIARAARLVWPISSTKEIDLYKRQDKRNSKDGRG